MGPQLAIAHTNTGDDEIMNAIDDPIMGSQAQGEAIHPVSDESLPVSKSSNTKKIIFLLAGTILFLLMVGGALLVYVGTMETKTKPVTKSQPVSEYESPFGNEFDQPQAEPKIANEFKPDVVKNEEKTIDQNDMVEQEVLTGNDIQLDVFPEENLSPSMRAALYGEGLNPSATNEPVPVEKPSLSLENTNPDLQGLRESSEYNKIKIEELSQKIDGLQKQGELNAESLSANQKAITQTAQLIVSLKDALQKAKNEIIQVRAIAYDNQDSIKAMETKIQNFQLTGNANSVSAQSNSELVDIKTKKESIVDPFEAARKGQQLKPHEPIYPTSGQPKQMVEAKNKPPVANDVAPSAPIASNVVSLSQLWVQAVHNDKAVVYDQSKQYLLVVGTSYKPLGKVLRIDHSANKVYGQFENGTNWVISRR